MSAAREEELQGQKQQLEEALSSALDDASQVAKELREAAAEIGCLKIQARAFQDDRATQCGAGRPSLHGQAYYLSFCLSFSLTRGAYLPRI